MQRLGKSLAGKVCYALSVLFPFTLLFYYKFSPFLPIGISFYTFQIVSYCIDVRRGRVELQKSLLKLATYVTLFPQLVAGPIVRYADVAAVIDGIDSKDSKGSQGFLKKDACVSFERGVVRFLVGLGKKVLIANVLGEFVTEVSVLPHMQRGILLSWGYAAAICLQLYFDFSGYSDMAIGLGRMLGFSFPENFNYPFIAKSVSEFWRRWHMTLGGWFRDYVYIPLGGNRVPKWRHCLNLLLTFLVSGFWHGSSLTYLLWGAIHGLLQIAEVLLHPKNRQNSGDKRRWWQLPLTFALLCFTWIFFRANSMEDALWILSRLFWDIGRPVNYLKTAVICLDMPYLSMFGMLLAATVLFIYDLLSLKQDVIALVSRQRFFVRWPIYVLLLVVIALFSHKGIATEFIYFQF